MLCRSWIGEDKILAQLKSGKAERQKAILKLVKEQAIATQTELRDALHAHGIGCDQATLSRDMKEIGLVKVSDVGGAYHYSLLEEASPTIRSSKISVLKRFIKDVEWSGNMLCIKTDPGHAMSVGEALDHLGLTEVIGDVAGDNTLFILVKEGVRPKKVAERILKEIRK